MRSSVLEPATRGTINVLWSCVRAGTVRRVVFTSSVSTLTAADPEGRRKAVLDESCLRALDDVWRTKPVGWVRACTSRFTQHTTALSELHSSDLWQIYILSKRLTEEAAFRFARENGVHLVSLVLPTVAGPFLTPSVPTSIQLLLSPITGKPTQVFRSITVTVTGCAVLDALSDLYLTRRRPHSAGDPKLYAVLASVHARFGCVPLAHVQDACDAHVFLMEAPRAEGRYLCAAGGYAAAHLARLLASRYPPFRPGDRHEWFHFLQSGAFSDRLMYASSLTVGNGDPLVAQAEQRLRRRRLVLAGGFVQEAAGSGVQVPARRRGRGEGQCRAVPCPWIPGAS